ncbi:hypothetical protein GSI_12005 [Ganoderma sinense ZZ0214-1]|uniref:Uncharacterized protein n=1 Tax=Ganoderma sinense ZZ0214-1 TaxID=1077348 RepID=A0A2G8RXK2_9APHY|nr:hypothetical protein GSI_12005 [Ganoderma sinense ZZ0214-1]
MVGRPSLGDLENRRVALAAESALDYMPMPALLSWRATCLTNYLSVNQYIRGSLLCLLSRFFPDPVVFLQAMSPWSALIIGEAALAHVLRDNSICGATLELAIGNLYFQPFVDCLSRLLPPVSHLASLVTKPAPTDFPFHRHITRIAEFRLSSGLYIVLYESSTPSACDVVSGYWTSALMNFVTGFTLGCAYPRLTFNRLSLLCDVRTSAMAWWDHDMARRLEDLGFGFDLRPDNWPLSCRASASSSFRPIDCCGKSLYICPLQGRYFGDPGSMVLFFDGFRVDLDDLHDLGVAPYGPMVAWRLPSIGTCKSGCIEDDPVLPPFVISMLFQFADDTTGFLRAHRFLHTVSGRDSHSSIASHTARRRGRRYST